MAVSHLVGLPGWLDETCRPTRQSCLHLPSTAALTDPDADITDVFPDVELATPGIDGLDKTHFSTHTWDPLMLCRIIQTFMMRTIQEFYHTFLVQQSMIYYGTVIDVWHIGANVDELDGNTRYLQWLKGE